MRIIVTEHPAVIDYIRELLPQFKGARVLPSVSAQDAKGASIAGDIPVSVAAEAKEVFALCFNASPPKGRRLTVTQLRLYGAHIKRLLTVEVPKD